MQVDYGTKLSGEEYDKRIVALHENLPPTLSREMERQLRHDELETMIDYRLGCNFPKEKRDMLWKVQERVEKKRTLLMLKYLFRHLFKKSFVHSAQNVAGYLVDEYAKVLNKEELEIFFGQNEAADPALPIDMNNF